MGVPAPEAAMSKPAHVALSLALALVAAPASAEEISLPGLSAPVELKIDRAGVPHLFAANDLDLARAQGFLHASDRFFQMDSTRRETSGDLAELLGFGSLDSDIQLRTVGLRRAAERTAATLSPTELALFQAYADGVNHWLATNPLPPEYAALELTRARTWTPLDSLVIGKGIAASLSLDIDTGNTADLARFVAAGESHGFDGATLFFEDVRRIAPMDPASTIPDATREFPFLAKRAPRDRLKLASAGAAAVRVRERFARVPRLARALERHESFAGSNEWGVAGRHSTTGAPMIANDPHLGLDSPSTFYESHLVSRSDPAGPLNTSGVGFPGVPGVILGQNERISWGATTNPMDVADVFQDELHVYGECSEQFALPTYICIKSGGVLYPVEANLAVRFDANRTGDGILDNVGRAAFSPLLTVPFRSFGPVIDIENPFVLAGGGVTTALVLQFTGFHATGEVQTFLRWNRARNLDEFRAGLASFDFGSQNWAYTDVEGNLAYFASAELPLRADLEAGPIERTRAPAFVRDGISGLENWVSDEARSQGQAIPFAVLPPGELPQTVNPRNGYFVNANNDPAGTSLDNDGLNQRRPGKPGAVYYLSPGYDEGLRAGRITRLIQKHLKYGRRISPHDMRQMQLNDQQLDAELMLPFLLRAYDRAKSRRAPDELTALARERRIAEAIGRLRSWDYSTPTGIPEGFDDTDGDFRHGRRGMPFGEARASVAATLYNLWRAKAIRRVIDARLSALGLGVGAGDALKALHHLLKERPFDGAGASGVDFFAEPASLASAADRRDFALLSALADALDALASPEFAPAFGGSTDQGAYRWGKLHRITFEHRFLPEFSVPPAGGYSDLSPELPGVARDGGYEVVNASSFSARADTLNAFRFGGGPVRRYVGASSRWSIAGWNVVPGGRSGDPANPSFAVQLGKWLTGEYHRVDLRTALPARDVTDGDVFVPPPGP
jgi:penicillin G amidase